MDDPWGSPWTSADPKPPSPAKTASSIGLEPPPRAFLSTSSSPRLPAISGSSPWADDDDGFGDWAAPDAAATGWSNGWGGSEGDRSPRLTPTPKDEGFGKPSPIAWPGSIALPKPASSSSFRQPSPSLDPWSSEFSLNVPLGDDVLTPRLPPDGSDGAAGKSRQETAHEGHTHLDSASKEDLASNSGPNTWMREENAVVATEIARDADKGVAKPEEEDKDEISPRTTVEIGTEEHGSTRSSLSNDESEPGIEAQDSPITSIDEDSRARLRVQRTASGKVQELVQKFDGIARQASEEPTLPVKAERGRSRGRSPLPASGSNDSDDSAGFGDFEDAEEEEEEEDDAEEDDEIDEDEAPRASTRSPSTSPARTPSPKPRQTTAPAQLSSPPQPSAATPSKIREMVSKFGEIKFDVPMGDIEKLFGRKKGLEFQPGDAADADVSDSIITDSFTEITERKTWYRISRLGSSRKHNTGDDDNYKLVAWPTSTLHLETIKVVRRWMEEDSITGRATLGGTVSKYNMFGWDSAAEPVSLDKVFGRKTKSHSRAASLHQPPRNASSGSDPQGGLPSSRKASGPPKSPTQGRLSMGISPVPSFGWSSGAYDEKAPAQVAVSAGPITAAETAVKTTAKQPLRPAPASFTPPDFPAPPIKAVAPPPIGTERPLPVTSSIEDDDDDWGEMVSSPQMDVSMSQTSRNDDVAPNLAANQQILPPMTAFLDGQSSNSSVMTPPNDSQDGDPWGAVDFSFFDKPSQPSTTTATAMHSVRAGPPPAAPVERNNFTPMATPTFPEESTPPPIKRKVTFDEILSASTDNHFTPTTPIAIISPIPVSATTPTSPYPGLGSTEDSTVKRLVRNLPDLSYMLR